MYNVTCLEFLSIGLSSIWRSFLVSIKSPNTNSSGALLIFRLKTTIAGNVTGSLSCHSIWALRTSDNQNKGAFKKLYKFVLEWILM